jgi:hypothetical protein
MKPLSKIGGTYFPHGSRPHRRAGREVPRAARSMPTSVTSFALVVVMTAATALGFIGSAAVGIDQASAQSASVVVDAPVMGGARVSAAQMAAWVRARSAQPYLATVTLDQLATFFVQEGNHERVSGDLAFVQAVVETGWFGFGGRVPASANNFGGIGATDSSQLYSVFRSAQVGVRAHIQHLRAYGDPTATVANLAHPLEDPRFTYVTPKGKAPMWSNMGSGNWATDPDYSQKILRLYSDLVAFAGYPSPPPPFGNLDVVTSPRPGQVKVAGWAIDPDTTAAMGVHIYVNNTYAGAALASLPRPDVGAAFPAYGPNHGFSVALNTSAGANRVCVFAINVGPGSVNSLLGCRSVTVVSAAIPFGNLDLVRSPGPGQVRVAGWTIDPDTADPIGVHVYVNGRFVRAATASLGRPDIGVAYPAYGPNHGFNAVLNAPGGVNQVCVYAINVGPGSVNTLLGCRSITLPTGNPFGNLDLARSPAPGQVRVAGWTIDPDTAAPIAVHVYVNGRFAGSATASLGRPDIGVAFPAYGPNHGFDVTVAAPGGAVDVCVYAINVGGGSINPPLGCRRV